jgi:Domain of unknown function (DUF6378)
MQREVITGVTGAKYDVLPSAEQQAKEKVSILDEAAARFHGEPGRDLITVANFWSQFLATRYEVEVHLKQEDVCLMMSLLKTAQLAIDPTHRAASVDACGYFALMERVQK